MLRLFYQVDEDYGSRVAEGLGMKDTTSFFEKIGKAIGLTKDKSHVTVQDDPTRSNLAK